MKSVRESECVSRLGASDSVVSERECVCMSAGYQRQRRERERVCVCRLGASDSVESEGERVRDRLGYQRLKCSE